MIYQTNIRKAILFAIVLCMAFFSVSSVNAQSHKKFKVIAFYTGRSDLAHISFMHEANRWFPKMAEKYNFTYDSTNNWANMNPEFLAKYQVVIFLDTRTDNPGQRSAFEQYMKKGGSWMGFHFSAFALTPSDFPQNWDWYHNEFLGSGQYVSNTWHPTSAILKVEDPDHPVTKGLPTTFKTNPNEWYRWEHDLRKNPDIDILLAVDSTSFPLGTGPKQHEIWHSGYYPVAWTNKNYRMVYFNIGHNDMDYDGGTNKELSQTFENADVDKLIINSLLWLGKGK
ncbi:ThuA domain-containing protein [Mucilaginibacter sp. SJ]|uniref:ThuA domain-containing protein n=1 Tax=Mucilaginibacter sp. SJ TaxID=3029053 RepID=UPI0023A9DD19|nr:ThuA domain-containing protein [Mucilaginibacter sp. SJ]WEA00256.1 ThuA domain-containing protein [Mucilaginibacter sp. SJ]